MTLVVLVAIVALLIAGGAVYQAIGSSIDSRRYPPPGRLIEVGSHRLHIHCAGKGGPTVVLEAGGYGAWLQWAWVQPGVAQFARACAYDRAGLGWSDPAPGPRTASVEAEELRALLTNGHEPGPYVLVASSYGALVARAFAARYADRVAGMVLVDPAHPWQYGGGPRDSDVHFPEGLRRLERRAASVAPMAALGLVRLMRSDRLGLFSVIRTYPPELIPAIKAILSRTPHWRAGAEEMRTFDESSKDAAGLVSLGDVPLAIVAADSTYTAPGAPVPSGVDGRELNRIALTLNERLTGLSSSSEFIVVQGATHVSLSSVQQHADRVVEVIRRVVEKVRERSRRLGVAHERP